MEMPKNAARLVSAIASKENDEKVVHFNHLAFFFMLLRTVFHPISTYVFNC